MATFVKDVTFPDGTGINPKQTFTKTWRLKNNGTCTWNTSYKLIYDGGELMEATKEIPLTVTVQPGGTIDVSVELVAPSTPGTYTSYWALQSSDKLRFGSA